MRAPRWPSSRPRRSGRGAAGRSPPPRDAAGYSPRRTRRTRSSRRRTDSSPRSPRRSSVPGRNCAGANGSAVMAAASMHAGIYTTRTSNSRRSVRLLGPRRPSASCAPAAAGHIAGPRPQRRASPRRRHGRGPGSATLSPRSAQLPGSARSRRLARDYREHDRNVSRAANAALSIADPTTATGCWSTARPAAFDTAGKPPAPLRRERARERRWLAARAADHATRSPTTR